MGNGDITTHTEALFRFLFTVVPHRSHWTEWVVDVVFFLMERLLVFSPFERLKMTHWSVCE